MCNCGGSGRAEARRQLAERRQQQQATRTERVSRSERNEGQGMYWTGKRKASAQ